MSIFSPLQTAQPDAKVNADHSEAPVLNTAPGATEPGMGYEEEPDLRPGPPPIVQLSTPSEIDVGDAEIDNMFSIDHLPVMEKAGTQGVSPSDTQSPSAKAQEGMTTIPKGWTLKGDIQSTCAVAIDCLVFGRVFMDSGAGVEILSAGKISGSVKGLKIVVRGEVDGEIEASGGLVDIKDGAQISGKVTYSQIRMDGGAHQMELHYVPAGKAAKTD